MEWRGNEQRIQINIKNESIEILEVKPDTTVGQILKVLNNKNSLRPSMDHLQSKIKEKEYGVFLVPK